MYAHSYGLRPSPQGTFRRFRLPETLSPEAAPDVDLRREMAVAGIRHKNQESYNSCVFCSGTVAAAYLSFLTHRHAPAPVFSAFYSYYLVRQAYLAQGEIGTMAADCGATGADFMRVAKRNGLCPEAVWPSDAAHFSLAPSAEAKAQALDHQALESFAIPSPTIAGLRATLAATQLPLQIGIAVPPELESDPVGQTGLLDEISDASLRNILGYHEVLLVASETVSDQSFFWIWNSWGDDWGNQGNCRLPAALLTRLIIEARVMMKIE